MKIRSIRWVWGLLVIAMCCGCTDRMRQKSLLVGGDPALATKQDVEDLKKLVNDRFDRLEHNQH